MTTHPTDDLAAYALGVLDEPERPAVAGHLETCPTCRAEARSFTETAWTINETASRDAPLWLRRAIIDRAARRPSRSSGFLAALRRPIPLVVPLALAAVLVLALAGYSNARRDADRYAAAISGALGAKVVPLAATAAGAGVRGSLVNPVNGAPYLILDLPDAGPGKTWEAWVIRGDIPTRAGVSAGRGLMTLRLTTDLATGDVVAVTAEPAGGVDQPTGSPVLVGKS